MTHTALTFLLDGQRYGVPVENVERVIRAVEITPLPNVPAVVLGMFDMGSRIIPVLSLRHRFGLPEKTLTPEDYFLVVRAGVRTVALMIDEPGDVVVADPAVVTDARHILPQLDHLRGALSLPDGLVLLHDLATCLSLDEAQILASALSPRGARDA